jgi:hypothetical protein
MKTIPKCPKCKKEPISYIELLNDFSTTFDVYSGVLQYEGIHEMGLPYCVYAECNCGHRWRLKSVSQINEIRNIYEAQDRLNREA